MTASCLRYVASVLGLMMAFTCTPAADVTPIEAKAIAEEGFVYGLPIVMNSAVPVVIAQQDMQGFDPKAPAVPDFKLTSFYESNLEHVGKKPGEVIKTEAVKAPEGAVAWRVMYVSRTWDDRLVPVTGIVVAPKEAGNKPRIILNWLHGTTGGARNCAPSLAEKPAQDLVQRSATTPIDYGIPYLTEFLKGRYVVVATDYQGQGGPGVHQYLVGNSAARNGIDIVRAALSIKEAHAAPEFLTLGWSQGGHAALFTGEEQPGYAAELKHRGVAAIAPGSTDLLQWHNIPHAFVLARAYASAYDITLDDFPADGKKLIGVAGDSSITGIFRESLKLKGPLIPSVINPAMKKALDLNVPGQRKSAAPILVLHGELDNVVSPEDTKKLLPRAEKSGSTIKVSWYPGKDHRTVIGEASKEILEWLDARVKE